MIPYKIVMGQQRLEAWHLLQLPFLAIPCFLCYLSWRMLRLFILGVTVDVKIGVESIRFGDCEWRWRTLSYFGGYTGMWFRKRLKFQVRGETSVTSSLPINHGITSEQYDDLIRTLKQKVATRYPHVQIGGACNGRLMMAPIQFGAKASPVETKNSTEPASP